MATTEPEEHKPHIRIRAIYLVPNLLTIAAIFSGFYAIISAMNGRYTNAAFAIFIALILDGLDGRVARLLHAQSEFGVQLDSLSDMVCFGITPALVMYTWSLSALGKPGWLIAFVYTVCTALRLARFNIQTGKTDKRYFYGLPTPAAAACVASIILICSYYGLSGKNVAILLAITAIVLSALKVSTIRYQSFKDLDIQKRVPFIAIVLVVLGLALIAFDPPDILFLLFFIYIISGPIHTVWTLYKHRKRRKERQSHGKDKEHPG